MLYETLAGRRAFTGETVSETLADVLKSEPHWAALPTQTPATVCNVIRRCLEKEPRRRIRDIGDVQLALDGVFETAPPGVLSPAPASTLHLWQRPLPAVILAVSLAAIAASVGASSRTRTLAGPSWCQPMAAVWSRDGRELFYREDNRLMVVNLDLSAGFKSSLPKMLFDGYINLVSGTNYDVSPDGKQFVLVQGVGGNQMGSELRVVQGWFEELKRRVPAK